MSEEGKLRVDRVHLLKSINGWRHHTADYEVKNLVVRRGQDFEIEIVFDKDFKSDLHDISVELRLGHKPVISDGSLVEVPRVTSPVVNDWGFDITRHDGSSVRVTIYTPADCLIGKYKMVVRATTEKMKYDEYEVADEIYVLFNPWCEADAVYMADDKKRDEYVLQDFNQYYWGNSDSIGKSFWSQAQFEPVVLECAFYLLKASGLSRYHLGNPVQIARTLSSMMNSKDNDGVLVGNWTGEYEDGTSPTEWSGSEAIFEQYMATKKPVKYGQCWVFAGLGTSVFRALGIPSRTVTTFEAGRDRDMSLTIDNYFDEHGSMISDMQKDFVWNFHVWNDIWMTRPDMPDGYGGWQALDTCPQELSGGLHRCGPASLTAVKLGHVYYNYDTLFMFAEVNGEEVDWVVRESGKMYAAHVDKRRIGKAISTKEVGAFRREDITDVYKFKEGTGEERAAMYEATKHVKKGKQIYEEAEKDVKFVIKPIEETQVGNDVTFRLKIINENDKESREMFVTVTCYSVRYTGVKVQEILKKKEDLTVAAGDKTVHKITVSADDYRTKLTESASLVFFVMAGVRNTAQIYSGRKHFVFNKPDLKVEVPEQVKHRDSFEVALSFTNPLPEKLERCIFRLESPGIEGHMAVKYKDVAPKEETLLRVKIVAKRPGKRHLNASFHSTQLTGLTGMGSFTVVE
ncbi:hemocyte protein-glutamine gamma-glutamyltransferase-like [Ptychodera flava]|uniref:hemocyte protein-glutamine gamma-glutamyltransferase-like n=1 Tax=Ptychodera flava TaxID=63121 RepID=UPI00396A7A42